MALIYIQINLIFRNLPCDGQVPRRSNILLLNLVKDLKLEVFILELEKELSSFGRWPEQALTLLLAEELYFLLNL